MTFQHVKVQVANNGMIDSVEIADSSKERPWIFRQRMEGEAINRQAY